MRRLVTFLFMIPLLVASAVTAAAQSPTPTEAARTWVRTDILPGVELTVEEVEPGVFKVLDDGVRTRFGSHGDFSEIVAGHDGSILLVEQGEETPRRRGSFSRLGSDESFAFPTYGHVVPTVSPDGTVWVVSWAQKNRSLIHSLTDGTWTKRSRTSGDGPAGIAVAPDGTIWTTHPAKGEEGGVVVTRLGPDGWQRLKKRAPSVGDDLVVTEDEEVWLVGHVGGLWLQDDDGAWQQLGNTSLWRYRDDARGWEEVTVDALTVTPFGNPVEVGSDGTVWFAGVEPLMADGRPVPDEEWGVKPGDAFLRRFDGTDWRRWGPTDGVPPLGDGTGVVLKQAPDGGLWMTRGCRQATWEDEHEGSSAEHWGVVRFDGSSWQHFLSGHCTTEVDMASDGSLWLKARSGDLYVITPKAVASTK